MAKFTKISDTIEDGNITIKKLAEKIGVTRQQVQRWKAGTSEPTASNIKALCKEYEVSADYILELPKGLKWPRE